MQYRKMDEWHSGAGIIAGTDEDVMDELLMHYTVNGGRREDEWGEEIERDTRSAIGISLDTFAMLYLQRKDKFVPAYMKDNDIPGALE